MPLRSFSKLFAKLLVNYLPNPPGYKQEAINPYIKRTYTYAHTPCDTRFVHKVALIGIITRVIYK